MSDTSAPSRMSGELFLQLRNKMKSQETVNTAHQMLAVGRDENGNVDDAEVRILFTSPGIRPPPPPEDSPLQYYIPFASMCSELWRAEEQIYLLLPLLHMGDLFLIVASAKDTDIVRINNGNFLVRYEDGTMLPCFRKRVLFPDGNYGVRPVNALDRHAEVDHLVTLQYDLFTGKMRSFPEMEQFAIPFVEPRLCAAVLNGVLQLHKSIRKLRDESATVSKEESDRARINISKKILACVGVKLCFAGRTIQFEDPEIQIVRIVRSSSRVSSAAAEQKKCKEGENKVRVKRCQTSIPTSTVECDALQDEDNERSDAIEPSATDSARAIEPPATDSARGSPTTAAPNFEEEAVSAVVRGGSTSNQQADAASSVEDGTPGEALVSEPQGHGSDMPDQDVDEMSDEEQDDAAYYDNLAEEEERERRVEEEIVRRARGEMSTQMTTRQFHPLPSYVRVGRRVLAFDPDVEVWYPAKVERVNSNNQMVYVRLINWSDRWSVWKSADWIRPYSAANLRIAEAEWAEHNQRAQNSEEPPLYFSSNDPRRAQQEERSDEEEPVLDGGPALEMVDTNNNEE